jgi:hypothetical protein
MISHLDRRRLAMTFDSVEATRIVRVYHRAISRSEWTSLLECLNSLAIIVARRLIEEVRVAMVVEAEVGAEEEGDGNPRLTPPSAHWFPARHKICPRSD